MKYCNVLLKTIDWKTIWKICTTIIFQLHFDRNQEWNVKKKLMKNVITSDTLVYYWICTTIKIC